MNIENVATRFELLEIKNLVNVLKLKERPDRSMSRLVQELFLGYNLQITYVEGKKNVVTDAFSRGEDHLQSIEETRDELQGHRNNQTPVYLPQVFRNLFEALLLNLKRHRYHPSIQGLIVRSKSFM